MRWIFRLVGILIVAAVLVVAGLLLLPGERLARIAADQMRAQTGRALELSGDVRLSLWPVLGVETGPVRLGNADWAGPEPMLTAERLSIGVAAAPLLRGEVKIERIVAQAPVLRLEQSGGRVNWDFSTVADTAPASGPDGAADKPRQFALDRLSLRQARVVAIRDGSVLLDRGGIDLDASWPAPEAPAEADITLAPGPEPVTLRLSLGDPRALMAGRVSPALLRAQSAGGSLSFDGRVSAGGDAAGSVSVRAGDSARLMAALGAPGVRLPPGLGRRAEFDAELTYTAEGRAALRGITADLDGNILTGDADILLRDRPMVTARLTSPGLDLSGIAGPDTAGRAAPGGAERAGWSDAPIEASALGLADAEMSLRAGFVQLPDMRLGETRLGLGLERSRAVLTLEPVPVFSGTLSGQLVANNRGGLSVGGRLDAAGIELAEALPVLAGIDKLQGRASGRLEFLSAGQSEAQIMNALSGSGNLAVGRGFFTGFDLEALLRSGRGNGGSTVFDSATGSFTIERGNLSNSDLALVVKGARVEGAGRVGIGARDIDYTLFPVLTRNGRQFRIPLRITGPWSGPSFRPDLGAVLEAEARARREELEAQAEQKLREKLGEELDTGIAPEQSVEDALKDKLEEEARKGLLNLLGVD